jgi:hypothetical protein
LKKIYFSSYKLPKQQLTNFWCQGILGVKVVFLKPWGFGICGIHNLETSHESQSLTVLSKTTLTPKGQMSIWRPRKTSSHAIVNAIFTWSRWHFTVCWKAHLAHGALLLMAFRLTVKKIQWETWIVLIFWQIFFYKKHFWNF